MVYNAFSNIFIQFIDLNTKAYACDVNKNSNNIIPI